MLIIGGGVAGIQAALDCADGGVPVVLVERQPTIGGKMAKLDKTFPTVDCSACILGPKMVDVAQHPNITLYAMSEVEDISGYVGNFTVKIRKRATYVDWSLCTGCGACASGCPKGAIHMLPDREGFLYPTVTDACIQCGHCAHICPVRKQREPRPEPAVFAAWNPDAAVRHASTAGGVFPLLAEYILDEGGVVFGAALDEELQVRHIAVKDKAELPRLRGAKPVQSDLGDSFRRVRHYLDQGRRVLFSGTPCQVDGLYHYLGEHPEKLLTCDVLCRGVCSPGVWAKLVQSMAYIKRKQPVAVQFCGKLPGEKERRFHVRFDGGAQYDAPFGKSDFGRGLRQRLFLRPVCHRCPYASTDRPADLTLGMYQPPRDFHPEVPRYSISLLLVNSAKGAHYFDTLPLKREKLTLEQAVACNGALAAPTAPSVQREDFFAAFAQQPFQQVRNRFLSAAPLPRPLEKLRRMLKKRKE